MSDSVERQFPILAYLPDIFPDLPARLADAGFTHAILGPVDGSPAWTDDQVLAWLNNSYQQDQVLRIFVTGASLCSDKPFVPPDHDPNFHGDILAQKVKNHPTLAGYRLWDEPRNDADLAELKWRRAVIYGGATQGVGDPNLNH